MTHRVPTETAGRSRRRRALLAGGAVLGLGAVATLAAWSDDVWVVSSFTTSPFNVEAAVNPAGDDWEELNAKDKAGDLAFAVAPTGMLPGDSVYAPLNLRVERGESRGQVSLASTPTVGDLSGNDKTFFETLRLSLYAVAPTACNAARTPSDATIGEFHDEGLPYGVNTNLVTLPANSDPVGICFKVTLPADAGPGVAGGNTGELVWHLQAEPIE